MGQFMNLQTEAMYQVVPIAAQCRQVQLHCYSPEYEFELYV